jgi:hypothetical protein
LSACRLPQKSRHCTKHKEISRVNGSTKGLSTGCTSESITSMTRVQELESLGFETGTVIRHREDRLSELSIIAKSTGTAMFLKLHRKHQAGYGSRTKGRSTGCK